MLLGVSSDSKLCAAFLNMAMHYKTIPALFGCGYFFNLLMFSTVHV